MDAKRKKTLLLIFAVAIYIITSSTAIISSWITGLATPFDLSLTVSIYVGLQRWTATLYFAGFIVTILLLYILISKTKMHILRRIAFIISFVSLLGLCWFPVQYMRPESPASQGHAIFSDAFFVCVTVTLILMFIFSKKPLHKLFAVSGVIYGILYIVCYIAGVAPFRETILIWESGLIFLYIFEFAFLLNADKDSPVSN